MKKNGVYDLVIVLICCVRRSNKHEVAEVTWENGEISMHGVGGINEQAWEGNFTLESIVNQATSFTNIPSSSSSSPPQKWDEVKLVNPSAINWRAAASGGKTKTKRGRSCSNSGFQVEESACGSGDPADATMMTWASFESPTSLKTADHDHDDYSLYHDCSENQEGERTTKEESFRSQSSARRSRAAAVHNMSERRRRDRINQKMKTLQKLVPNASKTDKASMLDEVIEYLKQLQSQIHMMSNARNMPPNPMMMPLPALGMQQLQMSLMARMGMGMGMGMGMLDVNNFNRNMPFMHAASTPSFVPPPFTMPQPHAQFKPNADSPTIPNFNDAYNTFIAQQSMNMDFLNKMSALYNRQQGSQQPSKKPAGLSLPNHAQGQ
ncbi:hypothetical protein ACS0TY_006707 [Phlomoides rotata]